MVERLKAQYEISWFPEDGENFPVRVFLMKDEVTVGLDSTGESLHKRGYRKLTAKAPHCGESGCCTDRTDSLECGKDPGGSLLRKRHLPY